MRVAGRVGNNRQQQEGSFWSYSPLSKQASVQSDITVVMLNALQ